MLKVVRLLITIVIFLIFPYSVLAGNTPVKSNSQYTTPSGQVAANGSATETIIVHLHDTNNSPVVGDVISLSSSNNTAAIFNNTQTTDAQGDATFTVKTTIHGDVKITMYDSTNSVTFTDWFTVSFYDDTKGCINVPAAPVLTSVVSNANNKATLTWTVSANPVNNYLVSFGIETGKYIYGDPNVGPQGTTSYTAQSLTGNKKYYFVVSATNNCGRSSFSNEMSVVVNPVPITPKPTVISTPTPTLTAVASTTPTPDVKSYIMSDIPITPQPTDKSVATVSVDDVKTRARNIGLGIMGVGMLIIGIVFIVQKNKKNISIPLISNTNTFQEPNSPPPPSQPFSF